VLVSRLLVSRLFASVALSVLTSFLDGCSTESEAVFQTARSAIFRDSKIDKTALNSNYRYLRVTTTEGREALLVLGYVDAGAEGVPVEVWYSGEREALRLQNGRLVSAVGMPQEWRNVSIPSMPDWGALTERSLPLRWTRVRDVMPGYRVNVRDEVTLHAIAPPGNTKLQGLDPTRLVWFEERVDTLDRAPLAWLRGAFIPENALPPARYGVAKNFGAAAVVYAEQCLEWNFCFAWQRWPPEPANPNSPGR